jgi:PAS domain S-box-containing protein
MVQGPLAEDIQNYAQNIVDTVREPLLILDATLRVQSANRAFYQTFHVSSGETEGRLIYELGNGQWDIPDLRTLLEDIVPKSSVFDDFELEHTFPDIGRRVMLLNARKLQAGQHGELLVLAMEDVTARKRAEEALLEAGALQSAIFNSANFSSIATDEKGVIQIFNVGAERMLGYTAAEVMNKITPADISDPQEVITRAKALSTELGTPITPGFEALVFKAARGIEDIYELTYIRKDGSRFPAVVSVTALRDDQSTIIGYLLIGTDNTARKQVEAERMLLDQRVRDQQFYTRSLIESNIDALITTDPRGIITDVNKQMEALTGCTRDELIGAPFKDHFTNPERAEAGIKLVLGESKLTDYELTVRARDGKETVVSYNATTFHDRARKLQGVFAAARDITERKLAEEALKNADQRKNEFLATLAHELRNPLAPIRNSLCILRMAGDEEPATRRVHEMMERQVNHLVRLVDDLLEMSRITSGKIDLRKEPVEIATVIRSAVETSTPLIDAGGHQIATSLPLEPLTVEADPVRLSQVIANLLNNAAKYTEPGGQIWLTVSRDGHEVVVLVRDTGIGISSAILPQVFQMFIQADRDHKRSQGGLGIGLALAKRLIEMHGGRIEAKSAGEGLGSEFMIRLPLAQKQLPVLDGAASARQDERRSPCSRILIVDDNQDAASSLGVLLSMLGNDVQTAHDGVSALEAMDSFHPSVVLLDLGMPGMSGYEVARRARELPQCQNTILIALTGCGQEEDRRRTREAGIDHHLVKPVDVNALELLLAEVQGRKVDHSPPA